MPTRHSRSFAAILGTALVAGAGFGFGVTEVRAGSEIKISMTGNAYAPLTVKARRGDVLKFVNDDFATHAVYVPTLGFGVDLGAQKQGETKELPLGKAGSFKVLCVFHADMAMTVAVAR